ncbi:MAG: MipA/OmpV family protein [Proteobacteria bacterium]|nr:MipA/OmpV family protein [Pseudomonadota bacterium]
MKRLLCGWAAWALWPLGASAQSLPQPPAEVASGATGMEVAPPASPDALPTPPEVQRPDWEAAFGLILGYQPEYMGSDRQAWRLRPAFLLRWGRFAISNGSGMVTRSNRDVARGLSYSLVDSRRWRASVGLRVDQGRSDGDSGYLRGMGDIDATVRARLYLRYQLTPEWHWNASWNPDILGRGGGALGDVELAWERERAWWDGAPPLRLGIGGGLSFANGQYMQRQYGVTAAQSLASGYPVYEPGSGLQDVHAGIVLRGEFMSGWGMQLGLGVSRLLGPAVDSPLTRKTLGWGVNAGLMRRF